MIHNECFFCKAERRANSKTVEGFYYQKYDEISKRYIDCIQVINQFGHILSSVVIKSRTLKRYTGFKIDDVRLYEGDIVISEDAGCKGVIKCGLYECGGTKNIGFYVDWINNDLLRKDLGFWFERKDFHLA